MKWNDEVRNKIQKGTSEYIYSLSKAMKLYDNKKCEFRQLSLMKQENIRMAIKEKISLDILYVVKNKLCGYCFKYFWGGCETCPVYKRYGEKCFNHEFMETEHETLKGFAEGHEKWLKDIGLWLKKVE